jgi:hypothetical protein
MQIDVVLFDGFDELAPYEVRINAAQAGADFYVRLVSSSGKREIVAAHGLRITVAGLRFNQPAPPRLAFFTVL